MIRHRVPLDVSRFSPAELVDSLRARTAALHRAALWLLLGVAAIVLGSWLWEIPWASPAELLFGARALYWCGWDVGHREFHTVAASSRQPWMRASRQKTLIAALAAAVIGAAALLVLGELAALMLVAVAACGLRAAYQTGWLTGNHST